MSQKNLVGWAALITAIATLLGTFGVSQIFPEVVNKILDTNSTVDKIKSGKDFLIAFSVRNTNETNCLQAERSSPLGDFLVGGVYNIRYIPSENRFHTTGLNQGKEGCPWEDSPNPRPGSNLDEGKMILWGATLTFDERGWVRHNSNHVGYILFPPAKID